MARKTKPKSKLPRPRSDREKLKQRSETAAHKAEPPGACNACGNEDPAYLKKCPRCGSTKCNSCDMGDDVECPACDFGPDDE